MAFYLVFLGLVMLCASVLDVIGFVRQGGSLSLSMPAVSLLFWVVAWLAWQGKRGAWNAIALLAPLGAGAWLGALVAVILTTPWKLLAVFIRTETWGLASGLVFVVTVGLFAMLARDTHRHPADAKKPRWAHPAILTGLGALPTAALIGLILALLQGSWTKPAVDLARQQLGDRYEYRIQTWQQQYRGGEVHGRATVIAYSEEEIQTVNVAW